MSNSYTEDHLVERHAIQFMQHELGWDVVNCYDEWSGGVSNQGRDGKREGGNIEHRTPNFEHRSGEKWKNRTNPDLPVEAIEGAVEEICRDRTALSLAEANREIDKLLKQGVKVSFPDQEHGGQRVEVVSLVDWIIFSTTGYKVPLSHQSIPDSTRSQFLSEEINRFHQTVKSNNIVKSSLSVFTR